MMLSHIEPALQKKTSLHQKNRRMAMNIVNRAWTFLITVSHTGTTSTLRENNWQFS